MELLSPIVTLFLVMDPLGNVPLFLMRFLGLEQPPSELPAASCFFLIALRMAFPADVGLRATPIEGEPFIVPLAIPLTAVPSTLATLLFLQSTTPRPLLLLALTIAWAVPWVNSSVVDVPLSRAG